MKGKRKYKMPIWIHQLAHHLCRHENLRINKDVIEHGESGKARYGLLYQHDMQTIKSNRLRTLILYGKNGVLVTKTLIDLFDKLWYLRLLDLRNSCLEELADSVCSLILLRYLNLQGTNIKELPRTLGSLYNFQTLELGNCHGIQELLDSIGNLTNLRHLGLSNTNIKKLPETTSNLLNLQTLELNNCYKLEMLPTKMNKFVNLRHLGLHLDWDSGIEKNDLISMPPGLSNLTSLTHLSRFVVGPDLHCGLGELKELMLHGKLCITKLKRVVNVHDAEGANLKDKQYVDSLMLRWSDAAFRISETVPQQDVIDQLQPHENLKHLCVENYNGEQFLNWIRDTSLRNLPSLKTVQLKGLHRMKSFGIFSSGFENLETLDVSDMPKLESWFIRAKMNCLTALRIVDCPNLKWLTELSPSIIKRWS